MLKKIKNFVYSISLLIFSFLVFKYYFSEENIALIDKSRTFHSHSTEMVKKNLPILKDDTSNIIFYTNDVEEFNSTRKKRFWEKLISK